MSTSLPPSLAAEQAVARLFGLMGFRVESVSIEGRQIDLIATRKNGLSFGDDRWIVEITTDTPRLTSSTPAMPAHRPPTAMAVTTRTGM